MSWRVSYRFASHGDRPGRIDANTSANGMSLVDATYGDAATIRIANVGRRRRKDEADRGFWLDTIGGKWLSDKQAADATVDTDNLEADLADVASKAKVIPYVEDTRNILLVRHTRSLDDVTATSLRYALERGAEAWFQLEDSELDSNELPDPADRGRFVFTESAEGGAGVLRRLVLEPDALAQVARIALERSHFDPENGADLDHAPVQLSGARRPATTACCPTATSSTTRASTATPSATCSSSWRPRRPHPDQVVAPAPNPAPCSTRLPTRRSNATLCNGSMNEDTDSQTVPRPPCPPLAPGPTWSMTCQPGSSASSSTGPFTTPLPSQNETAMPRIDWSTKVGA
ncbi:MAG: DUF1998 domain-containing protein [Acidimicrobiia bacterium]|nr:DUF1998 domain-containing protein [Acidimicrobiia bacterium]